MNRRINDDPAKKGDKVMKNRLFWDVKEVDLKSLRVGPIEMYIAYSVYEDDSSDVEVRALDDVGDIYGCELIVQDRYGEEAYKKACYLITERGATEQERKAYQTFFVTSFAGGQYKDGTRGKIQDALDQLHDDFLAK
jgi:hypothetical protein